MTKALEAFAPKVCRVFDSAVLEDFDSHKHPKLTLDNHHQQAAVPVFWNRHWMMAIVDASSRVIGFANSLPQDEIPPPIRKKLIVLGKSLDSKKQPTEKEWRFRNLQTPLQQNTDDCGIYAIFAAVNHWYNQENPIESIDVPLWRAVLYASTRAPTSATADADVAGSQTQDDQGREEQELLLPEVQSLDKSALQKLNKSLDARAAAVEQECEHLLGDGDYGIASDLLKRGLDAAKANLAPLEEELADQEAFAAAYAVLRTTALAQAVSTTRKVVQDRLNNLAADFERDGRGDMEGLRRRRDAAASKVHAIRAAINTAAELVQQRSEKLSAAVRVRERLHAKKLEVVAELEKHRLQDWDQWSASAKASALLNEGTKRLFSLGG
ncbi:hypothetical protein BC567DRAFT_239687 [Phyllosticta citribraziliensis]